MSTITLEPIIHHSRREYPIFRARSNLLKPSLLNCYSPKLLSNGGSFCNFKPPRVHTIRAASSTGTATIETSESATIVFEKTYPLKRTELVEGKISVRLDNGKDEDHWNLIVGCTLPGKWILHWGVTYIGDVGSEWDQPPDDMRPPGSIPIKDYAIETPLKKSSEGEAFHEVKIDINLKSAIAAINFVLKDEGTGAWYQHRGRDFKVPLVDNLLEDRNIVGTDRGINKWPEVHHFLPPKPFRFQQMWDQMRVKIWESLAIKSMWIIWPENMNLKEGTQPKVQDSSSKAGDQTKQNFHLEGFYEEHSIIKEVAFDNSVSVSVRKCPEKVKSLLYLETDLPGDVVVHWGVCRDDNKKWEIPASPHPPGTEVFKTKALRTLLQPKEGGNGSQGLFTLDDDLIGFLFVLKLNETTWLRSMGNDFFIPLSSSNSLFDQSEGQRPGKTEEGNQVISQAAFTDEIINEIRNLVSDISSEKRRKTKSKEAQEGILQEIEKLAAEAYSIFRGSIPTFSEDAVLEETPAQICSGTGTGFEILCQGFNWESHKSGRWYTELKERAAELASLGFTVIWLPPPTDSVSPEGYMPRDLYNLNSRYGSFDELTDLVKTFHESNIKVLGDVVLNHRCAQHKNQNGVWNIFGGRLNWDDRAVVADDPHFQGRGNKSSGDNFHAAPNIDHSQEFVRKDLKEWLCWLRKEIGYDGWRLDFVRGFWGGYVKDYMDATEPYFAVGEYWDSLSYTFGEMDHNQDAHRQRIVDWINATSGAAGAFDVTTKGILHAALERCEYWRLSDEKGKPPGVMGWWPSRAVTFIENHDTGSTQGHWRFPREKEMQGYAYTLTHPGTPAVFYDHIFSHRKSEISALLSIRNRNKIHCRSTVKITKVERDVYAAIIDEKVAMKIGPGHYEPPSGDQKWSSAYEGRDYKVWEASE